MRARAAVTTTFVISSRRFEPRGVALEVFANSATRVGGQRNRQGLTTAFGTIASKVALGVALQHDWGSQYTANTFVNEIMRRG